MDAESIRLIFYEHAKKGDLQRAHTLFMDTLGTIDPAQPTPSEQRILRRNAHREAVKSLDIAALRARAGAANSVPALRAEVDALWRIVGRLVTLLDLNDSEIGDE